MKTYNITVNGVTYTVSVEEVSGAAAPVAAPAPAAAPAAPAAPVAEGEGTITAPMSGSIFKLLVNVGDTVQAGQVAVVLEAMKMENEIFTPCAGTVKEVRVAQGATVQPGDVLVVIG